jgi:hypothetical protein
VKKPAVKGNEVEVTHLGYVCPVFPAQVTPQLMDLGTVIKQLLSSEDTSANCHVERMNLAELFLL